MYRSAVCNDREFTRAARHQSERFWKKLRGTWDFYGAPRAELIYRRRRIARANSCVALPFSRVSTRRASRVAALAMLVAVVGGAVAGIWNILRVRAAAERIARATELKERLAELRQHLAD